MKARDIIPSWPRPRTTFPSYSNRMWEMFYFWPFVTRYSEEMLEQYELEMEYHRSQQEMVDRWFARWRTDKHVDAKMRPLPEWMRGAKYKFTNLMVGRP